MELRWLRTEYPKPSVDDVKSLRDKSGMGMAAALKQLTTRPTTVLQYLNDNQQWVDVPTITIPGVPP